MPLYLRYVSRSLNPPLVDLYGLADRVGGRLEQGRIPGGKSYGYNLVHSLKDDGQFERGQRTFNEAESSVVRRIF